MSTRRRRRALASIPIAAAVLIGSMMGSASVLAAGTCSGNQTEYVIPLETHDASLDVYDVNRDGIICVAMHGRKTVYRDNRP
jgi:hypothetical protein